MPAVSKNQMKAAQIAEGVKEGKVKAKPNSASANMAKSMSKSQIKEYTRTPSEQKLPQMSTKSQGKNTPSTQKNSPSGMMAKPPMPMRLKS